MINNANALTDEELDLGMVTGGKTMEELWVEFVATGGSIEKLDEFWKVYFAEVMKKYPNINYKPNDTNRPSGLMESLPKEPVIPGDVA